MPQEQSVEDLIAGYSQDEEYTELEDEVDVSGLFNQEEGFEWIITPEQFVDFWIAAIFLLVGTWQVITMFFLVVG